MGALPDHQAGDVGWQEDGGQQEVTADIPPLLRPLHQPGQAELLDPEGQGENAVEEGGGERPEDDWDDDGEDDAGQTKPWPGWVSDRAGQINLLITTEQSQSILPSLDILTKKSDFPFYGLARPTWGIMILASLAGTKSTSPEPCH